MADYITTDVLHVLLTHPTRVILLGCQNTHSEVRIGLEALGVRLVLRNWSFLSCDSDAGPYQLLLEEQQVSDRRRQLIIRSVDLGFVLVFFGRVSLHKYSAMLLANRHFDTTESAGIVCRANEKELAKVRQELASALPAGNYLGLSDWNSRDAILTFHGRNKYIVCRDCVHFTGFRYAGPYDELYVNEEKSERYGDVVAIRDKYGWFTLLCKEVSYSEKYPKLPPQAA